MDKKCIWEHTNDGEFITGCRNEFYINEFDNEELLQTLLYTFCPYCGKEIEQRTTAEAIQEVK